MSLIPFIVLWVYMTGLYVLSLVRNDNGTADIGYGIGFLVLSVTAVMISDPTYPALIMIGGLTVWAIRLATRIAKKNSGKPEDFRYRAWRESWGSLFLVRSYFQIYLLQGLVIAMVSTPLLASILFPTKPLWWLFAAGVLVWCLGFFFEAVGDRQLDRFLNDPSQKGRIMTSGLWAYTRHPNYFGESTMWIGMAIMASASSSLPLVVWISPALITFLLLKVSGVPLLEKRWEGNAEWEAYKQKTSVFLPLPPRP